ncbi:TenA family transcriptional regulator [Starkeya sp. 3C]|uniref:Aminopyrimidine aminohydrolase n=1 Tax=Ancylobacter moscoviensis TaxID=2597768 RepID=A0ABY3DTR0_9HYPH|nr:TenA family protein [Ancylobacter moscoviensis]TSJ63823.1 TenA family transcriptional regulator [Ancylobacter moscoviensis]
MGFSERLRDENADDWNAAVGHRFVDEIFRGTVAPDVMRRYLTQDYQFIDGFVALLGMTIATADRFESRIRFAQFAAMITSDENTYFQRSFDALGVPAAEREHPVLTAPTTGFQALMKEAAASRHYASCLAVLTLAEWLYLSWADRPGALPPADFIHAEWITLHNNDGFRGFVTWLRGELDRVGAAEDEPGRAVATAFFRRAVVLERAFFDHIYD